MDPEHEMSHKDLRHYFGKQIQSRLRRLHCLTNKDTTLSRPSLPRLFSPLRTIFRGGSDLPIMASASGVSIGASCPRFAYDGEDSEEKKQKAIISDEYISAIELWCPRIQKLSSSASFDAGVSSSSSLISTVDSKSSEMEVRSKSS